MQGLSLDGCVFKWILNFAIGKDYVYLPHWMRIAIALGIHGLLDTFWDYWDTYVCIAFRGVAITDHELDGVGLRWEQVLDFV